MNTPDHTPARSIGALARTVAARARQAHSARALCGATAAACIVLGCIVRGGGSVDDPEALILAAIVGGLAFFAWRLSRSVTACAIARRVDDELGLRGAFLAAYETERERPNSEVAQLGAARLVACIRRRDAMEAAIPHTVGFVALPFVALAGLLFAIDASDAGGRAESSGTLAALSLSAAIGQIADRQGAALGEAQMNELEQAAQAAAGAAGQSGDPQRRDLAGVAEKLDALAREAPPGSALSDALARAAAQAEAAALDVDGDSPGETDGEADDTPGAARDARDGAEPGEGDGSPTEGPGAGPGAGSGAGSGGAGRERTESAGGDGAGGGSATASSAGAGEAAGREGQVTPDVEDSRAQARIAGDSASDPATTGAAGPTRTLGAIRWWSERDAAIVRRWTERASRPGAPQSDR